MAIEFTQVRKQFGQVSALENVSLTVQDGEFVTLIGPSGCGKTTMLRIAAGLELPSGGNVLVNDDTPKNACRQHQIGVAFQRPALLASRTALSNVRMTLEITGRAFGWLRSASSPTMPRAATNGLATRPKAWPTSTAAARTTWAR